MSDNFLEQEWTVSASRVLLDMTAYVEPFCTPVAKALEDYGELVGSGTYVKIQNRTFIMTNQHVANKYETNGRPIHQLLRQREPRLIVGNWGQLPPPVDLALMPVSTDVWSSNHNSKRLTMEMICEQHSPTQLEMLFSLGFSAQRSKFIYSTLSMPGTGRLSYEIKSSGADTNYLFDIDYRPEHTVSVTGNRPLPLPSGFSGSAVWNTGFIESRIAGTQWTPDLAMVTGVICLWSEAHGCLRATRCEHIKPWLVTTQPPPETFIQPAL